MEPSFSQKTKVGKTAKIFCDGHFEEEVKWNFNLGPLPKRAFFVGNLYDILYIRKVKKEHQGYYECIGHYDLPPHYPIFSAKSYLKVTGKCVIIHFSIACPHAKNVLTVE